MDNINGLMWYDSSDVKSNVETVGSIEPVELDEVYGEKIDSALNSITYDDESNMLKITKNDGDEINVNLDDLELSQDELDKLNKSQSAVEFIRLGDNNSSLIITRLDGTESLVDLSEYVPPTSTITNIINAGLTRINPNPFFSLGMYDYEEYAKSNDISINNQVVPETGSSLKYSANGAPVYGDNYFVIPPGCEIKARYSCSVLIDNKPPEANCEILTYIGFVQLDGDKRVIRYYNNPSNLDMYVELAVDLKVGDETITVKGDVSVINTNDLDYKRYLIFWEYDELTGSHRYVGDNGKRYDEMRYSNYSFGYKYDAQDWVDNGDGTYSIALNEPWDEKEFLSGTRIGSASSGSTYTYLSYSYVSCDGKFNVSESEWVKAVKNDDNPSYGPIRNGTVYNKLLVLPAYRMKDDNISATGLVGYKEELGKQVDIYYGEFSIMVRPV